MNKAKECCDMVVGAFLVLMLAYLQCISVVVNPNLNQTKVIVKSISPSSEQFQAMFLVSKHIINW